jgi:ferrous iron transport protein B
MATILVVPLMNCLAKVPLYVLLIGMFFAAYKGLAMFFIATITIIVALAVAKILNLTVLARRESAPFVMEIPTYHLPTVQGVLRRCLERTWLFVKKIITVVIIVAAIMYVLIAFPGLSKEKEACYNHRADQAKEKFMAGIGKDNPYAKLIVGPKLVEFMRYWDRYNKEKRFAHGKKEKEVLDRKFAQENPLFFKVVNRGKDIKGHKDPHAKKVYQAYRNLDRERKKLKMERREEMIRISYLGQAGRSIEGFTKFAGFNWRVNIALLSSFAAKENSVATLGGIYQSPPGEEEASLGKRMKKKEKGWTPLHALAIMLFMAMYPPCIPTLLMVQLEAGTRWMLFATFYPILLGLVFAVLVFTGGSLLGLSGLQAMIAFYVLAIAVTVVMGLIKRAPKLT